MPPHQILYSEKYYDDEFEYRRALPPLHRPQSLIQPALQGSCKA